MAVTSKLIVFNDCLRELGSHPLADIVTTNTRLTELNGAFNHAVEYVLSRVDWNFAKRRATRTGTADTSFPPYTQRYTRPSDYLRKVWLKLAADDEFQIDHTETGAVFYAFEEEALIEYISDHTDNYDPANWPPQFTRCMVLYLALLVGPKLARIGDDDTKSLYQKLDIAIADAERQEAVFATNVAVPANRLPTMRRAIEMLGQQLAGTVSINSQVDQLRWQMQRSWTHTVRYVLSQGAWNFASKRAVFRSGEAGDTNIPTESIVGITEGYSVPPAEPDDPLDISGYDYSYELPEDFLHKIWLKGDVHHDEECPHQQLGNYMFTNFDPAIMEYIAESEFTTDPANWPPLFLDAVAAYLALTVAPEFTIDEGPKGRATIKAAQIRDKLEGNWIRKLNDAKNKDAIQQYPKHMPLGRFAKARMGSYSYGRRLH